jgi:hypothetical protein
MEPDDINLIESSDAERKHISIYKYLDTKIMPFKENNCQTHGQ